MSRNTQPHDGQVNVVAPARGRWEIAQETWETEYLHLIPLPARNFFVDPPCPHVKYFSTYLTIVRDAICRTDNSISHLIAARDFADAGLRSMIYARLPIAILENGMLGAARSLFRELLKDGNRAGPEIEQLADQYAHIALRDEAGLAEVTTRVPNFNLELVEARAVCEVFANLELASKYGASLVALREKATQAFQKINVELETPEEAAEQEKAEEKRDKENEEFWKNAVENKRREKEIERAQPKSGGQRFVKGRLVG
jgi:hypothetical protein